jgi:hypothetical protein
VKKVAISEESSSGSSIAVKWPPAGRWLRLFRL